jgi:hypothetical protein
MESKNGKRYSGVFGLVILAVVLTAAVSLAPAEADRCTQIPGGTIERLRDPVCEGAAWETKVRWRLTGPGQVLPRGLMSGTDE